MKSDGAGATTDAANVVRASDGDVEVVTQQNGISARTLRVNTAGRAKRPNPGHFGRIEPADEGQVLKTLYPTLPEFS
ncbi:MAG: hypothetical protein ACPG4M_04820 [Alphaproteobacteria bacterium]